MVITALDRVLALQLDGHVTCATGGNSGGSFAACVDVHVLERDIGGPVCLCRDGDGVCCRRGFVRLGDDGCGRLLLIYNAIRRLADILASVAVCRDLDATVFQVVFLRKRRHRQACD